MRKAGVLLAISSLPSDFGIGDLGKRAYEFVDILKEMKVKIWQVLPLTPLGFGNSPYQSSSSFAGDDIYIGIDQLIKDELLNSSDIEKFNTDLDKVEYDLVREHKNALYQKAFSNFKKLKKDKFEQDYQNFIEDNSWTLDYAIFKTFRKVNNNQIWSDWSEPYKNWIKNKNIDLTKYQESIDYELFLQFIFYRQWFELKAYANKNSIEIMGDLPIYLGLDSADVWENQEIFLLDENQKPTFVAGVPPDFFSKTGQLWGNPLYDWDKLKETNFDFWIKRLEGSFKLFDILRIDHFRAFDTYWKIPAAERTAIKGEWIEAPGYAFFDTIYKQLPKANIIAEDLGDLRKEVFELRDHYNLKGMKVFQFHFDPRKLYNKEFSNGSNTIIYTGTHDNNTLLGWYNEQSKWYKKLLKRSFKTNYKKIVRAILKYALNTEAEYVIIPVQDILELDVNARFNTPGQVGSPNWEWKLVDFNQLNLKKSYFSNIVISSGRS
ncbi:4-alpha-glucanotransferase [Francisella frigiditurris]|uniref:4-alpha-glucanotransferase n=1 Tax=Francisella frigiditurris TaxID=1542390 RepID=A0A1J0KV02_9GAMM|nr:4-alpha-glucanotransferase [Francisella frigiditurris]APC97523.1 4-alpha-glucanotransferase [Francisella frigiditurris]